MSRPHSKSGNQRPKMFFGANSVSCHYVCVPLPWASLSPSGLSDAPLPLEQRSCSVALCWWSRLWVQAEPGQVPTRRPAGKGTTMVGCVGCQVPSMASQHNGHHRHPKGVVQGPTNPTSGARTLSCHGGKHHQIRHEHSFPDWFLPQKIINHGLVLDLRVQK